jgi:hypothetical protein
LAARHAIEKLSVFWNEKGKNPVALACVAVAVLGLGLFFGLRGASQDAEERELAERHIDLIRDAPSSEQRAASVRRDNHYDGETGFVVPYRPDCPANSTRRGAEPPVGYKEWCERAGRDEGMRHGWHAEWYPSGRPSVAGEYIDGLRVGVWTRWYENGSKRVQAEFRGGLQHGRLISWDAGGSKLGEERYADGKAI